MSEQESPWNPGDVLKATLDDGRPVYGRYLGWDEATGVVMLVYDSAGLSAESPAEIIGCDVLVRASPLHYELAPDGVWTGIGHVPLTAEEEALLANSLGVISGDHRQLIAANFHYGLTTDVNDRQVDDYLNLDAHPIPALLYYKAHPFPEDIEQLLLGHRDDEYFLDEIWCDAEEWAKGRQLDKAREILTRGS